MKARCCAAIVNIKRALQVIEMNGDGDSNKPNESLALMESTRLEVPNDDFVSVSRCHSVNSRKDSGIRSNSRRSSIQHQVEYIKRCDLNISAFLSPQEEFQ